MVLCFCEGEGFVFNLCSESINIAGHYNSKDKEKNENRVGALRKKIGGFKKGTESQENVFRK
jgi:hypothetical protein